MKHDIIEINIRALSEEFRNELILTLGANCALIPNETNQEALKKLCNFKE